MYFFIVLLSLLLTSNLAFSNESLEIKYVIEPVINDTPHIHIKTIFKGNANGKTNLILQNNCGPYQNTSKHIKNISASHKMIKSNEQNVLTTFVHKPSEEITVEYDLYQSFVGEPSNHYESDAPVINLNHMHFSTCGVLGHTDKWVEDSQVLVSFEWLLPNGWKIASSEAVEKEKIKTEIGVKDLYSFFFIAGDDLRFNEYKLKGGKLSTVTYGKWEFKDKEFADPIAKIIEKERDFWNDHNFPYFLIVLTPLKDTSQGFGGHAGKNYFKLAIPNSFAINDKVEWAFAHEYFHTWNIPFIFNKEERDNAYWFTEGFTDYYANLFILRAGLSDIRYYIKEFNEVLVNYYTSPFINKTNKATHDEMWKDYEIQKLLYYRGNILAHNLNAKIKQESNGQKSFDDFIKSLITINKKKETTYLVEGYLTQKIIKDTARKFIENGIEDDIKRYIENGETIELNPSSLGPCITLKKVKTARFKQGFDWDLAKKLKVISEVRVGSNAYKAGIRKGQKLISLDHSGNTADAAKVTIDDNGKRRAMFFYPYESELKEIPQFILDEEKYKKYPNKCLSWFAEKE
jgi:predicted metalloprotease with PDZ domain